MEDLIAIDKGCDKRGTGGQKRQRFSLGKVTMNLLSSPRSDRRPFVVVIDSRALLFLPTQDHIHLPLFSLPPLTHNTGQEQAIDKEQKGLPQKGG